MTTKRSAAAATIFSRVWAPPPPLTSQRSGATWSAPSIAMSSRSSLSNGSTGSPSSRAGSLGRGRGGDAARSRAAARRARAAGGRPSSRCPAPPSSRPRPAPPRPRRRLLLRIEVGPVTRGESSRRIVEMATTAERRPTSTRSASTRSGRSRSTRSRRRTPATRGRRWRWPRSPTRSGSASCASTPRTRSGRTATASCSRPGTPRCCSTRCCTWPGCGRSIPTTRRRGAVGQPRRHQAFRQLDSNAPGHPEYRLTSGVETTTGPLGQGIATSVGMAVARQVAGGALQAPSCSTSTSTRSRRRRPDGGGLERGRLVRRPPEARQPLLDLRQQPHHDRRPHRARLRGRRRRALHRLRLERHPGRATPTTSSCSPGRSRSSRRRRGGRR